MLVKGGTENKVLTVEDVQQNSTKTDKIVLPYVGTVWGDLALELALKAVELARLDVDGLNYGEIVKAASLAIGYNVQRKQVRPTIYAHVTTTTGASVNFRVFVSADNQELAAVLDSYFSAGAPGLAREYADYYGTQYTAWRETKK